MANTFSALKRVRMTKRKTVINRMRKSRLRHQVREMRRMLDAMAKSGSKDVSQANPVVSLTFSLVDRSAKWGIIKKNTAARYKSRIAHRLARIAA